MPRPANSAVGSVLFCPPATVVTGITGVVPPATNALDQGSISYAAICGNPAVPAALQKRGGGQRPPTARLNAGALYACHAMPLISLVLHLRLYLLRGRPLTDEDMTPVCRSSWSIPREEGPGFQVSDPIGNLTRVDSCVHACGVASARTMAAYAPPLLAVSLARLQQKRQLNHLE